MMMNYAALMNYKLFSTEIFKFHPLQLETSVILPKHWSRVLTCHSADRQGKHKI